MKKLLACLAAALAAAMIPVPSEAAPATSAADKPGGEPLLRFGVVSDVHIRLAKDGETLERGYGTEAFEKALEWFRDNGADAVVVAGDIADTGLTRELKAAADVWYRVFPDDKAPDGRKVERLFIFGNHDACGMRNGSRVFPDEARRREEAIDADPQKAWELCFHEKWEPYYTRKVKGYDFFCAHWQPGVWCNGIAETASSGCAEAFRPLMEKCDPSRPFFYVQHHHPRDTVYGRCAWGVDDGAATKLLSAFPQAVAFSGHSHEPLTDGRALWRGAFTSVATGSMRYLAASQVWSRERTAGYENGVCNYYIPGVPKNDWHRYEARYDAGKTMPAEANKIPAIRVGMLVSVYADRMVFSKREFESGLPLDEDWVVELPARPRSFRSRAEESRPPQFPAGAKLVAERMEAKTRGTRQVARKSVDAVRLAFPAANQGGRVAEYEIYSENAGGTAYSTRICAVGGLYPEGHPKFGAPVEAFIPASALPLGATSVRVTPLNAFGRRGAPLVADIGLPGGDSPVRDEGE